MEIFVSPKSLNPYDMSIEKKEMKNASVFIANYHIYGSPKNYLQNSQKINNIAKSNILKTKTLESQRISLENPFKSQHQINNQKEFEINQSIYNLRLGQKKYEQEKESNQKKNILHQKTYTSQNNYLSQNYNLYSTYNNLTHSTNRFSSIPYLSSYNRIYNTNKYSTYTYKNNYSMKSKINSLKDIPSNPDDVIIKELPPNFQIMQSNIPILISNPNINMGPQSTQQNILSSENNNNIQPITEDINTNINKNEEIQENIENEEEEKKEIEEPQKPEEPEEIKEEPEPEKKGKYQITEFNGPIKLPEGYSTDDIDEFTAIQTLNDPLSNWKLQIDKPNYKIYSKPFKTINDKGKEGESRMFYLDSTIDCPAAELIKQLNNFDLRKNWEDSYKKGKLIKEEDLGNGIKTQDLYNFIKMPFIFADRDIVYRKKIWENYNGEKDCCLIECHNIEHPDYPVKEKPVRANLENKSKYIKPIDANKTKFCYVNKFDLKVDLGGSMMESQGSEKIEKWFKDLLKQLK